VTLDPDHPALIAKSGEAALDSAIFATNALPVRDVVVGGRHLVAEGQHRARVAVKARFGTVMRKLLAAL